VLLQITLAYESRPSARERHFLDRRAENEALLLRRFSGRRFCRLCDALGLGPEVQLKPRRIGSLLEAAKAEAAEFHILIKEENAFVCEPPEVIGPGDTPRIEG